MSKAPKATAAVDPMFSSYAQLAASLLGGDLSGSCLLDSALRPRGQSAGFDSQPVVKWLRSLHWHDEGEKSPAGCEYGRGHWLCAIPLLDSDAMLLGVFCVRQRLPSLPLQPARHAAEVNRTLKPLLDCIHRELAAALPLRSRLEGLSERTAELEWLFHITESLRGSSNDRRMVEGLLSASTDRLNSVLGVIEVPEKRLSLEYVRDEVGARPLREVWRQTKQHLVHWTQRQKRPLLLNDPAGGGVKLTRCKLLTVPVIRENGRVLGVMAYFNPIDGTDFASRHVFLARHLGRRAANLVEAQFDPMTGLYTRDGIEQMYARADSAAADADRTILYIDVDHMHVVNELHGFELGNELIVRIADLLTPPLLPPDSLAARISGDRFVVLLPESDPNAAAIVARQIQRAASVIHIGPSAGAVEVSISCGVATLVSVPQGFARALAAAELACKTAKGRGRNRVELYATEDNSMMRRQKDAIAVGELRAALKSERLLLYAQRIAPLQNPSLPGGYELLLRLRGEDGTLLLPKPLISAAQRYQLLPSIDRWVIQRALQMLAPYRSMLQTRGISMSINVSGQSIGDEAFLQHFKEQLKAANLPADCIMVEITEQVAVTNLARANELIQQMKTLGCRFALDDFGTGANSLTALKNLQIARVKIDGSFVRDILTNRNSLATVRAIVELAGGLSMDTVAEYVETDAIAREVRRLGVDYAQGYAFSKPEPLQGILESLDEDESKRLHKLFLEM